MKLRKISVEELPKTLDGVTTEVEESSGQFRRISFKKDGKLIFVIDKQHYSEHIEVLRPEKKKVWSVIGRLRALNLDFKESFESEDKAHARLVEINNSNVVLEDAGITLEETNVD